MLFDLTDEEVAQLQSVRDQLEPHGELRGVLRQCISSMSGAAPGIARDRAARANAAEAAPVRSLAPTGQVARASILDVMSPEIRARLEVWIRGNKLSAPHCDVLRAIHEYCCTTEGDGVLITGLPREVAQVMGKIVASLECLDSTLIEARSTLAQYGITLERSN